MPTHSDTVIHGQTVQAFTSCKYVSWSERARERESINCLVLGSLRLGSITSVQVTLRSNCQGVTLTPLPPPTVDSMYCDVVLIVCMKTSQLTLCDTGSGDVQKFSIWSIGSISGNGDEVVISTVSTTPVHDKIYSSTGVFREVHTREGGHRGGT